MKENNLYMYENVEEDTSELIHDNSSHIAKEKRFVSPVCMLKEDDSLWYPTYKKLIERIDRYDIYKKKIQFPEIYWGEVEKEKYIEEMKKRYLFLAQNAFFILAPLVRKESDGHFNNRKLIGEEKDGFFDYNRQVYLVNDIYLSVLMERLLFSSGKLEENELYHKILDYKGDEMYLAKVKEGAEVINNWPLTEKINDPDMAMYEILKRVRSYIEGQPECFNKQRKLCILDEYFRILRYSNDGKIWTSGFEINELDRTNNLGGKMDRFSNSNLDIVPVLCRGEGFSQFINAFDVKRDWSNKRYTCASLDEKDKQTIYLKLHDELPWDLEISCVLEEPELNSLNDSRLIRPDNTNPCGASFRIKEGDIFVSSRGFYHLCSNCGYIVNVPSKLLSEGIQIRIKDRCIKDKNLFRKMELISELQALDDHSLPEHKILFKEKK